MFDLKAHLKPGSSALILAALLAPLPALAQANGDGGEATEQVVVTGTSIRGVAPVGSNVISVGQDAIEAAAPVNTTQLLNTIPGLSTANAAPQGSNNSYYYSPTIHQLAGSASNTTLVLIDGRRIPQGNTQHSETDPNIIPTIALERVEVLADGASSIYGSDAVAGVVNFITRRKFTGLLLTAQGGAGDGYNNYTAALLAGADWTAPWGSGDAYIAYNHQFFSALSSGSRSYLNEKNHIPQGGTNFRSFSCSPATIQPAGSANIYLSPTAATAVANTTANAPCGTGTSDVLPQEMRDNVMVKFSQNLGSRLTISADLVYGVRQNYTNNAPGAVQATVFETGPQANPFYVNPPGVTATSQTIRFSADGLVPNGHTLGGSQTFYSDVELGYNINDNWLLTVSNTLGKDTTYSNSYGQLCGSCANLALNGTTNSTGSTTAPSVPGTTTTTLGLPLTTANALDVWNSPATNRTSAAVLAGLVAANSTNTNYNSFDQLRANVDGALFDLPAGPLKVALGGEVVHYNLIQDVVAPNNTGAVQTGAAFAEYRFGRIVASAYAELDIPIISPQMGIPLVNKFDIDIAGRYDNYSDVGSTSNPKFSANWEVLDGFTLLGNYSTSFVAPPLDSIGDPQQHYNYASSGISTYSTGTVQLPVSAYPGIAGVLPGCAATATVCTVGQSTVQGITIASGGGGSLKPQHGFSWSLGADIAPDFLPGFTAKVTYFNNTFKGGVTSPTASAEVAAPSLRSLFTVCPSGCSAAQVAAAIANVPIKGSLPTTAYFLYNFSQRNVLNLAISGIDLQTEYKYDTDNWGEFKFGDALTVFTKYDENFGGGETFSVMNTSGLNQTFPSVQATMRADFGWKGGAFGLDVFVNYTGSYRNWGGSTVTPLVNNAAGVPIGGGDKVDSNTTVDLHLSYDFDSDLFGADQVYLEATNIFDADPPFYNSATAYNSFVSSPIGRVISVGLRAKL